MVFSAGLSANSELLGPAHEIQIGTRPSILLFFQSSHTRVCRKAAMCDGVGCTDAHLAPPRVESSRGPLLKIWISHDGGPLALGRGLSEGGSEVDCGICQSSHHTNRPPDDLFKKACCLSQKLRFLFSISHQVLTSSLSFVLELFS